jgi:hypothetical protein
MSSQTFPEQNCLKIGILKSEMPIEIGFEIRKSRNDREKSATATSCCKKVLQYELSTQPSIKDQVSRVKTFVHRYKYLTSRPTRVPNIFTN